MLDWLYTAISWVMKQWHSLFSTFLDPASGITWALSIMFLVITVRVDPVPRCSSSRSSRSGRCRSCSRRSRSSQAVRQRPQGMSQAMMALVRGARGQPAGGLPADPAADPDLPVALPRAAAAGSGCRGSTAGPTSSPTRRRRRAVRRPDLRSFNMAGAKEAIRDPRGHLHTDIRVVAMVLIVIMCVTTFITQKQITSRSGPVEGQAATVQRLMLYGMPISLFVSGFFFPHRRPPVLVHQQPLDARPAVLHPPEAAAARIRRPQGEGAADKPVIDSRTLAPKPGASPCAPKLGRPTARRDRLRRRLGPGEAGDGSPLAGTSAPRQAGPGPPQPGKRKRR